MGRKKLVVIMKEELKGKVKDEKGSFLVVYDFSGRKNPKEFYNQIFELVKMGYKVMRIQKSVYLVEGLEAATYLAWLGEHYGADVRIFKVEKEVFMEM